MFLSRIKNTAFDILFPPLCVNCRRYDGLKNFLCADCILSIHTNIAFFCPLCSNRLPHKDSRCHPDTYLLGAVGSYDDPVLERAIQGFKYEGIKQLKEPLGILLALYLESMIGRFEINIRNFIVTPVPLHSKRLRDRGFNQAFLLAEKVSEHFSIETDELLVRIKNNAPQVGIQGREARLKNMKEVFAPRGTNEINGKGIIVVDDVFTSGATMNEAVRVLKKSGARQVIALVLAKA